MGPETPAPTRGEAGMASSLVITWGWGPPERRRLAEIPDLIAINSHEKLPQSGATDFAGNSPGGRLPRPTSRGISLEIPKPGKLTWNLAAASDSPGNFPGNYPGNWLPHPGSRGVPRGIQQPGNFPGNSPGNSGAEAGFR